MDVAAIAPGFAIPDNGSFLGKNLEATRRFVPCLLSGSGVWLGRIVCEVADPWRRPRR
jgi:hypothetical protein